MNSTYIEEEMDYETKEVCVDYIISLATVGSLFVVSEVLQEVNITINEKKNSDI